MKNLLFRITLPLSIVALLTAGIVTGCDKKEKLTDLSQTVQKAQNAEQVTSEADYDEVFKATASMVDETNYMSIDKVEGGYVFSLKSNNNYPAAARAPCHDGNSSPGLGFAKCCRDYVTANGCIKVTHDKDGWNGNACG